MKTKKGSNLAKKSSIAYSELSKKDKILLEKAKNLLAPLRKKYEINLDELFEAVEEEITIPAGIFNSNLTVLESTVKYLKENKNLSLRKISEIIDRDERNVWHIYNQSKKKNSRKLSSSKNKIWIPLSRLCDTNLSALESIVLYLKEELMLANREIATLLCRDSRTIWTVYARARKKNVK